MEEKEKNAFKARGSPDRQAEGGMSWGFVGMAGPHFFSPKEKKLFIEVENTTEKCTNH